MQAVWIFFPGNADSSTLSHTRKSKFLRVLHFFWFFWLHSGRVRNAVDLDCVSGPGPPPTVQICYYLQHFGAPSVPELKRYACRVSRTQAIRSLFFEIADSSTLSETRKSNFLRVLHFFWFFRFRCWPAGRFKKAGFSFKFLLQSAHFRSPVSGGTSGWPAGRFKKFGFLLHFF